MRRSGRAGWRRLGIRSPMPRSKGLIVILDGKRNDIGSTAEAYAQAYLGEVALDGGASRLPGMPML